MAEASLWRNPDFVQLWAAQTISIFGSLIGRTALPFTAILVLQAGPLQIALLSAAELVPALLVGPGAGVWVDRLRRRPLLIAADVGRALLLATIPLAHLFNVLYIEQLYGVALLVGALTMLFDVAYLSYLPSLVRREQLLEGNSKLAASSSAAEVGAFGVAGWLVQLLTGPIAILIDAVSFLFSAAFVGAIRRPEPPPAPAGERQSMRLEFSEGLRLVLKDRLLRPVAASAVTLEFAFRIFGTVFLLYATRELGFKPGLLGLIFAVGGVSSLLGALLARRSAQRLGIGPAMWGGLMLMAVSMLFVPLAQGATLLAVFFLVAQQLLGDGGATVYEINQVSLRQAITPDRMLGRVNASIRLSALTAMLAGSLFGGLLGETIGLRATLVVGAGFTFAAALWLVFSPARMLTEPPVSALEPSAATPARYGPRIERLGN